MILDFGPLDTSKPLVLVMNGWLRFGGGMANIAASQDPSLPFPFPALEAEVAPGSWKAVDATVGAPSGKTKTSYGQEKRPEFRSDALHRKYNIRWVEGRVLKQTVKR